VSEGNFFIICPSRPTLKGRVREADDYALSSFLRVSRAAPPEDPVVTNAERSTFTAEFPSGAPCARALRPDAAGERPDPRSGYCPLLVPPPVPPPLPPEPPLVPPVPPLPPVPGVGVALDPPAPVPLPLLSQEARATAIAATKVNMIFFIALLSYSGATAAHSCAMQVPGYCVSSWLRIEPLSGCFLAVSSGLRSVRPTTG